MPFDFYNGPASWEHFINDTLFDFLHYFIQAYLDGIFIYSKTVKNHCLYIWQVLERLQKAEIQVDIDKYEFHIQETKFLALIISIKDI